jgi:hypothetical protein
MFDDFDLGPQCEEFYSEEDIDWEDADVEDVWVDGIPLDGNYLNHIIDSL